MSNYTVINTNPRNKIPKSVEDFKKHGYAVWGPNGECRDTDDLSDARIFAGIQSRITGEKHIVRDNLNGKIIYTTS
jgi:hypothetical protein